MSELLIGIIGSLVATFIWVTLSIFYDIYSKRRINLYIQLAQDSARLFQHSINYNDYYTALIQAEKLLEYYRSIDESIKLFTYFPKKKMLIRTYVYNSLYVVSIFKNLTIGYEGKQELESRCEKFSWDYLYKIKYNENHEEPFLSLTLELLEEVNRNLSVKKGLVDNYHFQLFSKEQKRDILKKIVSIHSFNY